MSGKKKRIMVRTKGIHGTREQTFYDGTYVVNPNTRGVLFSGYSKPDVNDKRLIESRFIPYQLIICVEIKDYDGGMIVCNSIEWLEASVDIYESMSTTEMVERLR